MAGEEELAVLITATSSLEGWYVSDFSDEPINIVLKPSPLIKSPPTIYPYAVPRLVFAKVQDAERGWREFIFGFVEDLSSTSFSLSPEHVLGLCAARAGEDS